MSMDLPNLICKRCEHTWHPRSEKLPDVCPKCKSRYWNKERRVTKVTAAKAVKNEAEDTMPVQCDNIGHYRFTIPKTNNVTKYGNVKAVCPHCGNDRFVYCLPVSETTVDISDIDLHEVIRILNHFIDFYRRMKTEGFEKCDKKNMPCLPKSYIPDPEIEYDPIEEAHRGLDGALKIIRRFELAGIIPLENNFCISCNESIRWDDKNRRYVEFDPEANEEPMEIVEGASCDINYGKQMGLTNS